MYQNYCFDPVQQFCLWVWQFHMDTWIHAPQAPLGTPPPREARQIILWCVPAKKRQNEQCHQLIKSWGWPAYSKNLTSTSSSANGLFDLFGNNGPQGSECPQPHDLGKVQEQEWVWLSHRWLDDPTLITWPPHASAGPAVEMSKHCPGKPWGTKAGFCTQLPSGASIDTG